MSKYVLFQLHQQQTDCTLDNSFWKFCNRSVDFFNCIQSAFALHVMSSLILCKLHFFIENCTLCKLYILQYVLFKGYKCVIVHLYFHVKNKNLSKTSQFYQTKQLYRKHTRIKYTLKYITKVNWLASSKVIDFQQFYHEQ